MAAGFLQRWREKLFILGFGLTKVPLILFTGPEVVELSASRVEIKVPLRYRTKNHLGSMYFGAMCIGAEVAAGLFAMKLIRESGKDVLLIFKDFKADFTKRAEGDVHFVSEAGAEISSLVARAIETGERVNQLVAVKGLAEGVQVAQFSLTVSLKLAK